MNSLSPEGLRPKIRQEPDGTFELRIRRLFRAAKALQLEASQNSEIQRTPDFCVQVCRGDEPPPVHVSTAHLRGPTKFELGGLLDYISSTSVARKFRRRHFRGPNPRSSKVSILNPKSDFCPGITSESPLSLRPKWPSELRFRSLL